MSQAIYLARPKGPTFNSHGRWGCGSIWLGIVSFAAHCALFCK